MTPILIAAVVSLLLCAVVSTAFPILYLLERRGSYPLDPAGVLMVALSVCLALMLDFTLAGLFWPNAPVWAAVVLYNAMTGLMLYANLLVVRQMRREDDTTPREIA